MNFSVLPPEINSALLFAGAGSGPMLAAASAWDGLADELGSAAASVEQEAAVIVRTVRRYAEKAGSVIAQRL